jgi:hypothetical protein
MIKLINVLVICDNENTSLKIKESLENKGLHDIQYAENSNYAS